MKRKIYPVALLVFIVFAGSCKKIEKLPATPYIEFRSFTIFDTTDILGNEAKGGRLNFYFEDGDGDLGLQAPSDTQLDTTNLFLTLFRKEDGVMVQAPENDPLKPSSYRIPYLERLGQNKILKGTVSVTFMYLFYNPSDTIRYDFYIKDRAENISNTASTSEIIVSENGVYKEN
ncbi:MAG TPA: hypothetical protein VJ963_08305 [Bacteroidales bacterium]|nr:hypothetical protein [Bacteroidales bacterium]